MKLLFLMLIVIMCVISFACAKSEGERERLREMEELRWQESDKKVRTFSSAQNLEEAKRLLQIADFYFARKHLRAIQPGVPEYDEAQTLLAEIEAKGTKETNHIPIKQLTGRSQRKSRI
jgi:hypothetical protein